MRERFNQVVVYSEALTLTGQSVDSGAVVHVLPKGFHRIRHHGLFAATNRAAESIATARALLDVAPPAADPQQQPDASPDTARVLPYPCPHCGARMIVIEVFARRCEPGWRPTPSRIDTS